MMQRLTAAARKGGWLYHHVQRSDYGRQLGMRGFPDLILVRRQTLRAIEVKSRRGILTPEQGDWLVALAEAGAKTWVVWPEMLERACRALGDTTGS
jgi:hypothetical protein